jgi:hypothetical protein
MPEAQLQLLLLAAALCAARALELGSSAYRVLAAAFLALALFAKYHAHLAFLPVMLIAAYELAAGAGWRSWARGYGALAAMYAAYLLHHARFPTDYPAHFEAWYARGGEPVVKLALAATALLIPLALWLRRTGALRRWARPGLRALLAAVFLAAAGYNLLLRPFGPLSAADFDDLNLVKLGWQLSLLGLTLAIAGTALWIWRGPDTRIALLLVGLAFGCAFVAQGDSVRHQLWHARKLVPAVLPLAAAAAALTGHRLAERIGRASRPLRPAALALPLAVVALQLSSGRALWGHHDGQGAYAQAQALARGLPQSGLSLFAPRLAGLHLAGFATLFEGRPSIALPYPPPAPAQLQRLERFLRRRDRELVAVAPAGRLQWLPAGRFRLQPKADVELRLSLLEKPIDRLPRHTRLHAFDLTIARVLPFEPKADAD